MAFKGETDENAGIAGRMRVLNQKFDHPIDKESRRSKINEPEKISSLVVLQLAFQSLGVVYGDLSTSPLYVFNNTFPDGIDEPEDLLGALSLIIYSLTLIPLLKYVFIVCRANDNGQGGTFALYSLLCRHVNIKSIPNQDQTDEALTTYSTSPCCKESIAGRTKTWLESQRYMKQLLIILVIIGSCMVIGDGILTPAISVLSAVGGIKLQNRNISDEVVVIVAVMILVGLFSMQHYGTDKVSWLFAPIIFLWLLLIGGIGIFNIWKYDVAALKAYSPVYMYRYFKRGGKRAWTSLGGILLSITGTEALFAELSYFRVSSIQIAFTVIVFPCLLLAYTGQVAYLLENSEHVVGAFYHSIPDRIYWPMFIIATGAAVVASQSTITATFSLIKQAVALGCFPRVKVVHTSKKFGGQIYIPDINWILLVLCIAVTAGFKKQSEIGNALGTAVVMVMLVTTFLTILIMILIWHWHWVLIMIFTVLSIIVEAAYLFSVLFKVDQGGWVPLVIAAALFIIMGAWHYGKVKHYQFELHSMVSLAWILSLGPSLGLVRVPGVGLVYTELASGVPHIFSHLITNLPAIHSVVIFVCLKYLPVYTVPQRERFHVTRIGPKNLRMFRCVARYGYKDLHKKDDDFEKNLFDNLFKFVRLEYLMEAGSESDGCSSGDQQIEHSMDSHPSNNDFAVSSCVDTAISSVDSLRSSREKGQQSEINEIEFLSKCREAGTVHILGNTAVHARTDSRLFKRITIDCVYAFLRKICRGNSAIFHVPHESLLNVGQRIYV
ncbi:hypothetical protein SLA2020_230300 [Shorea laevis]